MDVTNEIIRQINNLERPQDGQVPLVPKAVYLDKKSFYELVNDKKNEFTENNKFSGLRVYVVFIPERHIRVYGDRL